MISNGNKSLRVDRASRFNAGDHVVLADGPSKYTSGTFLNLNEDAEWATIQESDGTIKSHPAEWLRTQG